MLFFPVIRCLNAPVSCWMFYAFRTCWGYSMVILIYSRWSVSTEAVQSYFFSPGSTCMHCSSVWLPSVVDIHLFPAYGCIIACFPHLPELLTLLMVKQCRTDGTEKSLIQRWDPPNKSEKPNDLFRCWGWYLDLETHASWSHVDNNYQLKYLSFHICFYL